MLGPSRFSVRLVSRARLFHTSSPALDLAKVVLVGRLCTDPFKRETSAGKPYYMSPEARRVGQGPEPAAPTTNWHTIFAFNESSHSSLARVGKGSTLYVEADLEMRSTGEQTADGLPVHDRALLRHRFMSIVNRIKPVGEEGEAAEPDD